MFVGALCLSLVLSSFATVQPVSAVVYMSFDSKPSAISDDTTPTFVFDGYDMDLDEPYAGSVECKIDAGAFAPCASPYTTPTLAAGNHTFVAHAVGDGSPNATISHAWNINGSPSFSGGSSVNGVAGVPVAVTDLQIEDADNDTLGVNLTVPSGSLALGSTTGITFTGSATGADITFSGTRTNLNSALATLTYTPSVAGSVDIDVTLSGANGGTRETYNGHYYRVINSAANWNAAKTAAELSTYGGTGGYLANITSAGERAYVWDRLSEGSWIGASDSALEGDWRWKGGPESGTAFWSGGTGGSAVGGAYSNWQAGQPDNYNGVEHCGEMRFSSSPSWNDENCNSSRQYVIEYGADGALPSLTTTQVSVTTLSASGDTDGDGLSNSIEANAPNGGDANDDGTADYTQANVSSQYNSLSNSYVVIQTSCTTNQQVQLSAESSSQGDATYDYPYGLANFTSTGCGTPGTTATITQYYYGTTDPDSLTLRKWNPTTGLYSTINDAVLSAVTVGSKPAVKVAYQVVDGGSLDHDGSANGTIVDPVGAATVVVRAPNAGVENQVMYHMLYSLLGFGVVLLGAVTLRRHKQ